jgi:hypothetical protein
MLPHLFYNPIVDAKQARLHNSFKNTKCKLLRTNAAIWFNKMWNKLNERKSAGGIVTAQSTAEDPLKMVVKKDRNM